MQSDRTTEHDVSSRPFRIGEWTVDPAGNTLSRNGDEVRIEPLVMDVLRHLARHAGELVTREELESEVWRGALIGYDAVTSTIIKLRKALHDDARNPLYIATIPKRGYRLIMAVEVLEAPEVAAPPDVAASRAPDNRGWLQPGGRTPRWLWVAVLATLLMAGIWMLGRPPAGTGANDAGHPPSILVLPFTTAGDEPDRELLAYGLTTDLISDLSGLSGVRVLSSNTAYSFRDPSPAYQQIGTELGVDHVLEGSLMHTGDTIRLDTRLIDTRDGKLTWNARYDRKADELFELQNELAEHVILALQIERSSHETERLSHVTTDNLSAYAIFQEGQRLARTNTDEGYRQAQAAYREAIRFDPTYGRAYGALAFTMGISYLHGWTDSPVETLDRALVLARRAVELDSSIPHTFWVLGYIHMIRKEYERAEQAVMRSIEVSPNFADGYGMLSLLSNNLGNPERAIEMITRGMELNPHYTWDYLYNLGRAYYTVGRYDEAIEVLERGVLRNENMVQPKLYLAASYIRSGRRDDAEWEVENIRVLSPAVTLGYLRNTFPIRNPEQMTALLADLKQAGLPE